MFWSGLSDCTEGGLSQYFLVKVRATWRFHGSAPVSADYIFVTFVSALSSAWRLRALDCPPCDLCCPLASVLRHAVVGGIRGVWWSRERRWRRRQDNLRTRFHLSATDHGDSADEGKAYSESSRSCVHSCSLSLCSESSDGARRRSA